MASLRGKRNYEFVANHAGTFMYHSHLDEIQQGDRGLAGAFIIDPQNPSDQPQYDVDLVMLFSGWTVQEPVEGGDTHGSGHPANTHGEHGGQAQGYKHDYNYWTINGKSFPDVPSITVRYGDQVRFRLSCSTATSCTMLPTT